MCVCVFVCVHVCVHVCGHIGGHAQAQRLGMATCVSTVHHVEARSTMDGWWDAAGKWAHACEVPCPLSGSGDHLYLVIEENHVFIINAAGLLYILEMEFLCTAMDLIVRRQGEHRLSRCYVKQLHAPAYKSSKWLHALFWWLISSKLIFICTQPTLRQLVGQGCSNEQSTITYFLMLTKWIAKWGYRFAHDVRNLPL